MIEMQVKNIMSKLFKVDIDSIQNNSSPDSIEKWDSIMHMNLVLALEQGFRISFTEDEIFEILNFELICEVIKSKITA